MSKATNKFIPGVDSGKRSGLTRDSSQKLEALERYNRNPRQANAILYVKSWFMMPAWMRAAARLVLSLPIGSMRLSVIA